MPTSSRKCLQHLVVKPFVHLHQRDVAELVVRQLAPGLRAGVEKNEHAALALGQVPFLLDGGLNREHLVGVVQQVGLDRGAGVGDPVSERA